MQYKMLMEITGASSPLLVLVKEIYKYGYIS